MRGVILLLLQGVLYLNTLVYAQDCPLTIHIQLIDAETGHNISDAQVLLNDQSAKVEGRGKYIFKKVCEGNSSISFYHRSYTEHEMFLKLSQDTTIRIALNRIVKQLEEVTVTANTTDANSRSSTMLNKQQRTESQGKNLADVLSDIAGVSVLKTGANNGKPVINGLYGNRLLLLNQGVRHESQQWGTDHAPEIDPFSAEEISIIKSADAVRYGPDALGGIVKLSAAPIHPDRYALSNSSIILNSNGRGMTVNSKLEGTLNKLSYRAGLTTNNHGNMKSASYYLGNTGNKEINGNMYAAYTLGKNVINMYFSHVGNTLGVFQGAHIGSKEDILARIANGRPFEEYSFTNKIEAPKQRVTHQLGKVGYKHYISDNSHIEAQYSIQRNHRREFDLRRVAENDLPMADIVLNTQQIEIVYSRPLITTGISGSMQLNNNVPGTGSTPIIPNFENHGFGSFFSLKIPVKSCLIETGIRYDYKYFDAAGYRYNYEEINPDGSIPQYLMTDRKEFHNISGIAGISHRLNSVFTWKSNVGLAWRAPSANELYSDGIHHGTGTYEVGNKSLESEKGLKWVNSLLVHKGAINGNIDVFAQVIDNYIYSQPVPDSTRQTIRGTFPLFQHQQDRALFYGADLALTMEMRQNLHYSLNLSVVKARNITKEQFLPNIPATRLQHALAYHINAKGIPSYIKVKHHFQAKQTRYEPNSDFAPPPPSYHLFDAIIASSISMEKHRKMEVQIGAENIFNKAYKDYMDRFRYYAHALGRNISVKINFTF
ncbi:MULTISPECIES: TonB-dependent receptor [Sphingobacterium]|uniref:TonB-dependent receptor n=1 Tax=Sphingobacterium TaxID=28453 RepID=UPI0013DBC652|nr:MULTISPECIES: TonB-dependent receptor [unclassified Sphingobacterium]